MEEEERGQPPHKDEYGTPQEHAYDQQADEGQVQRPENGGCRVGKGGPCRAQPCRRGPGCGQQRQQPVHQRRPPDEKTRENPCKDDGTSPAPPLGGEDEADRHEEKSKGHDERRHPDGDHPHVGARIEPRQNEGKRRGGEHGADGGRYEGGPRDHPAPRRLRDVLDADAQGEVALFPRGDQCAGEGNPQDQVADIVVGGADGGNVEQPRNDGDQQDEGQEDQEDRRECVLRSAEGCQEPRLHAGMVAGRVRFDKTAAACFSPIAGSGLAQGAIRRRR